MDNLQEELSRKTLEALDDVMTRLDQGSISKAQASVALSAIFTATSGLAGDEMFDLISEASKQVRQDLQQECSTRTFISKGGSELVLLQYQFGEAFVRVKKVKLPGLTEQITQARFDHETDPFTAARERFNGYARSMIRNGYKEIQ